jgi:hypothetical protein
MYHCKICNFFTTTNYNLKRHNISVKHLRNCEALSLLKDKYDCKFCNNTYSHQSSLSRHRKLCELKYQTLKTINKKNDDPVDESYQSIKTQLDFERIKFENELLKR